MSSILRLYADAELAADGYSPEWHELPGALLPEDDYGLRPPFGIKHYVRAAAGHRCVRCSHPWPLDPARTLRPDGPEWSPCDRECVHLGPLRAVHPEHGVAEPPENWMGWQAVKDAGPGWVVHARWRVLTVHHLDGTKANCRWWNLAALCQRCHLQIQGKVQMERVWPWEHSDWMKPYVAGFYALRYLGEEISREQAVARMEELLALERMVV